MALRGPDPDQWQWRSFAPQPGATLGPLDEVAEGAAKEYRFGFGPAAFRMFVLRKDDRLYGYVNSCPHMGMPLNYRPDEFLTPDGTLLMCTQHLALFRIEDGECVEGACEGRWLDPIPVSVKDGQIIIAEG